MRPAVKLALPLALALVTGLSACGVEPSDGAETASRDEVPYGLLDPAPPATTTTVPERVSAPATIWLVGGDGIQPVGRQVVAPVTVERLLAALVAGATADEAAFGLRSALADEVLGEAVVIAGVATIDLREAFAGAVPREQLLALAQIVYTVTELDPVQVVTFTLGGEPVDVQRGDGSVSDGAVTRLDYASIVAG